MAQAGVTGKEFQLRATFAEYPIETGAAARRRRAGGATVRVGHSAARGPGPGIAAHRSFLSYVASVVQVQVMPDGAVVIPRVDIAIDAGFNRAPGRVRSQLEGATIIGARQRAVVRDHVQPWTRDAVEFRRLPGDADGHVAPGDPRCTSCRAMANRRRGRAGCAADCAGVVQRDLRGDGPEGSGSYRWRDNSRNADTARRWPRSGVAEGAKGRAGLKRMLVS